MRKEDSIFGVIAMAVLFGWVMQFSSPSKGKGAVLGLLALAAVGTLGGLWAFTDVFNSKATDTPGCPAGTMAGEPVAGIDAKGKQSTVTPCQPISWSTGI